MDFSRTSNSTYQNLHTFSAAKSYTQRGWSVIPVFGDQQAQRPKAPAIPWKAFQQQHATPDMLVFWFSQQGYQVGIVTGQISQLAVLDLDTPQRFSIFQQQHPDLAATYTVATRRGFHLYFHIPAHLSTRSLRGEGVDWQWNGRYVVAPPSHIAGYAYTVSSAQPLRTLTQPDLTRIEQFVGIPSASQPSTAEAVLSKHEIIALYRQHAAPGSRNNALFQAALHARDYGWSEQGIIQLLAEEYAYQPASVHENPAARLREAHATIHSAFSRPPRPTAEQDSSLPTVLMEALLQIGQAATVRVLQALYQLGYQPGMYVSREQAITALSGLVGSHSIRKAFASGIFACVEQRQNPSPRPPTHTKHAAIQTGQRPISKCFEITSSKPSEIKKVGRFARFYRLPSVRELAKKLSVPLRSIRDQLPIEALRSAKETRKAVHRAYIERRPGKYPSKWLAKRLGVSVITKNRYDREIPGLHKRATLSQKRISWHNLNELSADLAEIGGVYLEDEQAKKYPVSRGLAAALLKQGRKLNLLRRGVNTYWIGTPFDLNPDHLLTIVPRYRRQADFSPYWQSLRTAQPAASLASSASMDAFPSAAAPSAQSQRTPHSATAASVDNPYELQALHARINALCPPERHISLQTLAALVREHGSQRISRAVAQIAARSNVSNPAGLLITMLKSEKTVADLRKLQHG